MQQQGDCAQLSRLNGMWRAWRARRAGAGKRARAGAGTAKKVENTNTHAALRS